MKRIYGLLSAWCLSACASTVSVDVDSSQQDVAVGRPRSTDRTVLEVVTVNPVDVPDVVTQDIRVNDSGPVSVHCTGLNRNPGDHVITLTHSGLIRTAIVHVPASYNPNNGTMLVVNFHGFSSTGWQEALLTSMNDASDERNFIVVYPEGIASSWNAGQCCGTAWADLVDDVGFVRALVRELEQRYCVDPARVFATGMSNGGFFSHRVACELSDVFAAVAPVAGVLGIDPSLCNPTRAVSVLHIHGTSDGLVPYRGGIPLVQTNWSGMLNFRSVGDTFAFWRQKNGCTGPGQTVYARGDTACVRYSNCRSGSEVELCTVEGGGHTWPGGLPVPFLGHTTTDLNATEYMLDFFERHPLL